jgi:hypothetical protein
MSPAESRKIRTAAFIGFQLVDSGPLRSGQGSPFRISESQTARVLRGSKNLNFRGALLKGAQDDWALRVTDPRSGIWATRPGKPTPIGSDRLNGLRPLT